MFFHVFALALLASSPAVQTETEVVASPGKVVIVAREEIADPRFRERLAELAGPDALELFLGAETEAGAPDAMPHRWRIAPRVGEGVDRRELALALRSAPAVLLRGGSFLDWYQTLLPPSGPTRLAETLRHLRREGTHLIAFGPAASFAAGATMIPKATLGRPRHNPRDVGLHTAVIGLALGPPAIVDAEGWPTGDALELLRALWDTKVDLGFFLEGEVALVHELQPHFVRCIGPGRAVLIDLDAARRQKRAIRGGRLALLGGGDSWSFGHARVFPAAERRKIERDTARTNGRGAPARAVERLALGAALEAFAAEPERAHVLDIAGQRLELRADEGTSVWEAPDGARTVVGVAFDLEWP